MVALEWHPSGSHLAVQPRGHSFAMVWRADTKELSRADSGIKVGRGRDETWVLEPAPQRDCHLLFMLLPGRHHVRLLLHCTVTSWLSVKLMPFHCPWPCSRPS